jgi:hypothetical protein
MTSTAPKPVWGNTTTTARQPFSFGGSQAKDEPPKPTYQLSEEMLIVDLPADAKKTFVEVFESVRNTGTLSDRQSPTSTSTLEAETKSLTEAITGVLMGPLTSLAHYVDSGQSAVTRMRASLDTARADYGSSAHPRAVPTPFIKRYVSHITKLAQELSQALGSRGNETDGDAGRTGEESIHELLVRQHEAILRLSTRIATLSQRLQENRETLVKIHKFTPSELDPQDQTSTMTNTNSVHDKFKKFQEERKQNTEKRTDRADLFGMMPVTQKPALGTGTWGFGGGAGGGFGQTNQGALTAGFGTGGVPATVTKTNAATNSAT